MVFSVDVQILKLKKFLSARATELGEDNSNYILTQIYNMILAIKNNNENV